VTSAKSSYASRGNIFDRRRRSDCGRQPGDHRHQIVPIADSALLSSKIVKNAVLKVYKGSPHGMCTTEKDRVNAELLAFVKS
jgi:hypothetical protein